jgi:hypothetical protein
MGGMSSSASRLLGKKLLPSNEGKPLWLIHPGRWGRTPGAIATAEFWDGLVRSCGGRVRFWQVGWTGDGAVQGCEYYLWTPRGFWRRVLGHEKLYRGLLTEARGMVGIEDPLTKEAQEAGLRTLVLGPGGVALDPRKGFEAQPGRREIDAFLAKSLK